MSQVNGKRPRVSLAQAREAMQRLRVTLSVTTTKKRKKRREETGIVDNQFGFMVDTIIFKLYLKDKNQISMVKMKDQSYRR